MSACLSDNIHYRPHCRVKHVDSLFFIRINCNKKEQNRTEWNIVSASLISQAGRRLHCCSPIFRLIEIVPPLGHANTRNILTNLLIPNILSRL